MLHHVEIYVADLKRAREFWQWLLVENLGYALFQEWSQGVSFKDGNTYIVFVRAEADFLEPAYHRKRPGLNHLAFHASDRDAVDNLADKLRERQVPILYGSPKVDGSSYALFFEDPDRMKVEYVCKA